MFEKKLEKKLKKLETIDIKIIELERKAQLLKNEIKEIKIKEWEKRKNEGWIPFVFKQTYLDSDGKERSITDCYAFSPNYCDEFEKILKIEELEDFLKSKPKDSYYYFFDEDVFQAVWPEKYITDDE
jgi:hypothetical protein